MEKIVIQSDISQQIEVEKLFGRGNSIRAMENQQ